MRSLMVPRCDRAFDQKGGAMGKRIVKVVPWPGTLSRVNGPTIFLNDPVQDGEAQTRPLDWFFSGDKRLEDRGEQQTAILPSIRYLHLSLGTLHGRRRLMLPWFKTWLLIIVLDTSLGLRCS